MKSYCMLIPAALFPYFVLFAGYCIFSGFLMDSLPWSQPFMLLLCALLLWGVSFFLSKKVISTCKSPYLLAKAALLLKLIHIPAFLAAFFAAILFLFTIFTAAFSVLLLIFGLLTIWLSGRISKAALMLGAQHHLFDSRFVRIHKTLSFVFCADVVSAIFVCHSASRQSM